MSSVIDRDDALVERYVLALATDCEDADDVPVTGAMISSYMERHREQIRSRYDEVFSAGGLEPAPPREGRVYAVVTTEGPRRVKLGFTGGAVRQRFLALSAMSPVGLRLLASWEATSEDERHLHAALTEHRLHGEWFEGSAATKAADLMRRRPWGGT